MMGLTTDEQGILSLTGEVIRLEEELRKRDALDAACADALLRAEGAVAGMIERIAFLEARRDELHAAANRYLDRARRAEKKIRDRQDWDHWRSVRRMEGRDEE